jgi:hypothetical protein
MHVNCCENCYSAHTINHWVLIRWFVPKSKEHLKEKELHKIKLNHFLGESHLTKETAYDKLLIIPCIEQTGKYFVLREGEVNNIQ